jgi:hypothetical protein
VLSWSCLPQTELSMKVCQAGGPTRSSRFYGDTPPLIFSSSCQMPGRCLYRLELCSSLARPLLQAQCRQFSTHAGRILRGDDLGPTREDAHQTFRVRKDETAKELPLSPLLDPVILEKRSRFEQTKERPRATEFTPLQKKLWENPFGMQYASLLAPGRGETDVA